MKTTNKTGHRLGLKLIPKISFKTWKHIKNIYHLINLSHYFRLISRTLKTGKGQKMTWTAINSAI